MVRELLAAGALRDRRFSLGVEDVQVRLIGFDALFLGRSVVGVHVAGDDFSIEQHIEVFAGLVVEREAAVRRPRRHRRCQQAEGRRDH